MPPASFNHWKSVIAEYALFCIVSNNDAANRENATDAAGNAKWLATFWDIKILIRLIESVFMTLFAAIIRPEFSFFCHIYAKPKHVLLPNSVWLAYPFTSQLSHMAISLLYLVSTNLIHLVTICPDRQKMWNLYCSTTVSYMPWHLFYEKNSVMDNSFKELVGNIVVTIKNMFNTNRENDDLWFVGLE